MVRFNANNVPTHSEERPMSAASTPGKSGKRQNVGPSSLERRIRGSYEGLPNSERLVADLLLDFPSHLATHSATELARLSGASKAAVTRLVQRLGYQSFAQARADARNAQQWGSPIYVSATDAPQGTHSAIEAHVAADLEVLRKTLDGLAQTRLDELVTALHDARRVLVIGHRNSALLATYARGQLGLLRAGVELAPMHGETLAEGLFGLGPQDVLLAVGFRRRVPAFLSALEVARNNGVRIAVITDPSGAAMARNVDWVIPCHCRGASMSDSYVAAVSLINFLASQLALQLGAQGRARLRGIEQLHEELGDLV